MPGAALERKNAGRAVRASHRLTLLRCLHGYGARMHRWWGWGGLRCVQIPAILPAPSCAFCSHMTAPPLLAQKPQICNPLSRGVSTHPCMSRTAYAFASGRKPLTALHFADPPLGARRARHRARRLGRPARCRSRRMPPPASLLSSASQRIGLVGKGKRGMPAHACPTLPPVHTLCRLAYAQHTTDPVLTVLCICSCPSGELVGASLQV